MRGKMLVFLVLLCLFLLAFGAGYLDRQTRIVQEEIAQLEAEIELLEVENTHLRTRVQELQLLREIVLERMNEWLEEWDIGEFEATAYTLECGYPWDDGFTYLETKAIADYTVAVDPKVIPLGSKVYVLGLGWRKADDIGAAVKGQAIDFYTGSGPKARKIAMSWGRRTVKAVYQK